MKIPVIQKICNYIGLLKTKTDKKPEAANVEKSSVPTSYAYPKPLINSTFAQKPISSKCPNYDPLYCDYSNLDEFAAKFSQKIDSQLMTIDKNDIENLIIRLQLKTKASPQLIKNVLHNLTSVSNYKMPDIFSNYCKKYNAKILDISSLTNDEESDYSLNCALNYLSKKKHINESEKNEKFIIVLDDTLLKQLEKSKEENGILYNQINKLAEKNSLIVLNIPAWDVKCKDNKYRSANFLIGNSMLEDLAYDVIKRIQNGEDLDTILCSDFNERAKNIFGKDFRIITESVFKKKKNSSTGDILINLQKRNLPPRFIKNTVKAAIKCAVYRNLETNNFQEILCKYLDSSTIVFSNDSMAFELKNLYKQIKEKYGENVSYMIPAQRKSYGYIAAIYAKLNGIDIEKFKENNSKNTIILDDIAATGSSMIYAAEITDKPLIFAYILATPFTKNCEWVAKRPENIKDILFSKQIKSFCDNHYDNYKLLKKEEIEVLKNYFLNVFSKFHYSCAFPHMIPDNIDSFSATLFNNLLMTNSKEANSALYELNNLTFKKSKNGIIQAYIHDILCNGRYLYTFNKDNSRAELFFENGMIVLSRIFDSKNNLKLTKEYIYENNKLKAVNVYDENEFPKTINQFTDNSYSSYRADSKTKTLTETINYQKMDDNTVIVKKLLDNDKIQIKTKLPSSNKTKVEFSDYIPHRYNINNDTTIITIDKVNIIG